MRKKIQIVGDVAELNIARRRLPRDVRCLSRTHADATREYGHATGVGGRGAKEISGRERPRRTRRRKDRFLVVNAIKRHAM